jgi:coproporphyrinogen III oxidase-like Fe-S oxidoreductase
MRAMTIVQPMQRNRISSNLQAASADVLQQGNRELRKHQQIRSAWLGLSGLDYDPAWILQEG